MAKLCTEYVKHKFDPTNKNVKIWYKILDNNNLDKSYGNFYFEWVFEELSPEEKKRYKKFGVKYKWTLVDIHTFVHDLGIELVYLVAKCKYGNTILLSDRVMVKDVLDICDKIFRKVDNVKTVINNIATEK